MTQPVVFDSKRPPPPPKEEVMREQLSREERFKIAHEKTMKRHEQALKSLA